MATNYPESIVLEQGSEEYNLLKEHSGLIRELADEDDGTLELTADILFGGDVEKWHNFVDIFFPELGNKDNKYFGFKNGKIYVLNERGGKEELTKMLDFFLVDSRETMMNFARKQAKKQLNAPSNVIARGVGIREPGIGAREYAAQQAARQGNRNNYSNYGNNENRRGLWANIRDSYGNNENENKNKSAENGLPEIRVNNNGNNGANYSNNNNNGSNTTVPSRPRPMTLNLGSLLPKVRKSNRRTRRSKSRRQTRKNTRRANRK